MLSDRGEAPPEWGVCTLGALVTSITSGGTPKSGDPRYYATEGIPFLKIDDLSEASERVVNTAGQYITEAGLEESPAKIFPAGTILISMYGTIGLVRVLGRPSATNQAMAALLEPFDCDHGFLVHALDFRRPRMERLASQTTQANISATKLRSLPVALPDSGPEQRRIAEILDTVDRAIRHTEAIIARLGQVKAGLLHDLLTLGLDQNGELRDPERRPEQFKDSPLGRIPRGWKVRPLGGIAEVSSSSVNKKTVPGEVPVLLCNYMDVYKNDVIERQVDFMPATASQSEIDRFGLTPGDVMITKDSETPDDIAVPAVVGAELGHAVLCGYHLALLRPFAINGAFLANALRSTNVNSHFRKEANGTTRYGLRISSIQNAPVPVPTKSEQERICEVLDNHAVVVSGEQLVFNKLKALKRGLMQDLLTGRVRVPADEPVPANA